MRARKTKVVSSLGWSTEAAAALGCSCIVGEKALIEYCSPEAVAAAVERRARRITDVKVGVAAAAQAEGRKFFCPLCGVLRT